MIFVIFLLFCRIQHCSFSVFIYFKKLFRINLFFIQKNLENFRKYFSFAWLQSQNRKCYAAQVCSSVYIRIWVCFSFYIIIVFYFYCALHLKYRQPTRMFYDAYDAEYKNLGASWNLKKVVFGIETKNSILN